jgi:hypothetical protein
MVIQQNVIDPIQEVNEYTGYCKINPSKLYVMSAIKLCEREGCFVRLLRYLPSNKPISLETVLKILQMYVSLKQCQVTFQDFQ